MILHCSALIIIMDTIEISILSRKSSDIIRRINSLDLNRGNVPQGSGWDIE